MTPLLHSIEDSSARHDPGLRARWPGVTGRARTFLVCSSTNFKILFYQELKYSPNSGSLFQYFERKTAR